MLSRRELSVAECRERLLDRGHEPAESDAAIERLIADRSLDDERLAKAQAGRAVEIKGRGRLRVVRELAGRGITGEVAQRAVAEVFGALDERSLVARALDKKLRGRQRPADPREHARLYQHLVRQGFSPAVAIAELRKRRLARDPEI